MTICPAHTVPPAHAPGAARVRRLVAVVAAPLPAEPGDGMRRNTLIIGAIAGLLLSPALVDPASAAPAFRALLFTKTTGYRHDSIPAGISMFQEQAAANNFEL